MDFSKEDKVDDLPEVLRNYLPKYLSNRTKDLIELENAIVNKNVQSVSSVCHRINGTAANYGLFRLEEISRRLQKVVKENNFNEAKALVDSLRSYLEVNTIKYTN
jgi:HPt (histidine-containing phosphotransfer) domain-containing protein